MDFEKNRIKSMHIHQYKCKCSNTWWGPSANNKCRQCGKATGKLPLNKMTGIGWFECACGRKYAGFCKGDIPSKCHGCQVQNLASFVLPGEKASKDDESAKKTHCCAVCEGSGHCPIVASIVAKSKRFPMRR